MSQMDDCEGTGDLGMGTGNHVTSLLRRSRIQDLRTWLARSEPLQAVLVPTEIGDGAEQIAALKSEITRLEGISDEDYALELECAKIARPQ
jgi:hypothetical protein